MSHYYDNLDLFADGQPPQDAGSRRNKRLSDPGPEPTPASGSPSSEPTHTLVRRESEPGRAFAAFSLRQMAEEAEHRRRSYTDGSSASQSFVSLAEEDEEDEGPTGYSQGPSAWRRETLRPDDHQSYAGMSSATQSFASFHTGVEGTPTHSTPAFDNYGDTTIESRQRSGSRSSNSPYGVNNPFAADDPHARQPARRQTEGFGMGQERYGQPPVRQQTAPSSYGFAYGTPPSPSMPDPTQHPYYTQAPSMPEAQYGQQQHTPPMPQAEPHYGQQTPPPMPQAEHYGQPQIPQVVHYGQPPAPGGYGSSSTSYVPPSPSMPEPYNQSTVRQPTRQPTDPYGRPIPQQQSSYGGHSSSAEPAAASMANPWDAHSSSAASPAPASTGSQTQHQTPPGRQATQSQYPSASVSGRQPTMSSVSTATARPDLVGASRAGSAQAQGQGQTPPQQGRGASQEYKQQSPPPNRDARPVATAAAAATGAGAAAALNSRPSQVQQQQPHAQSPSSRPQPQTTPATTSARPEHQTSVGRQQTQTSSPASANRPLQQQTSAAAPPGRSQTSQTTHPLQQQQTPSRTPTAAQPQPQRTPTATPKPATAQTQPPSMKPQGAIVQQQQSRPAQQPRPSQPASTPARTQTNGQQTSTTYPPSRPAQTEKPAKEAAKAALTTPHPPVRGPGETEYLSQLLALDDIPPLWNLLANFFTWILLAGFLLFPGTFTSLQENPALSAVGVSAVNVVKHVSLYVIAWVCTGIGGAGMLYLWYRWRGNYIWISNRLFMPGFTNSLAGVLSTISSIFGSQDSTVSIASKTTLIATGAATVICGLLLGIYVLGPIRIMKNEHDRKMGKQHAGKHGAGYAGTQGRPRFGLHASQMDTKYVNMLLALDSIPMWYNLVTHFFTWILLAGFVLFPGTFTSLSESQQLSALGVTTVNVVKHVSLYVIAWVCTGIGAAGMLYMWFRWSANYIWLVNRVFMPGFMNSVAGVIGTLSNVLGAQAATLSVASTSTIVVTSATAGVCGLLTAFYMLVLIRGVKNQHDRQVGRQRAGKHGEGYTDISGRA